MQFAARTLILFALIVLFYMAGRFVIFEILYLDNTFYQNVFEIIYFTIAGLLSLILSAIIMDKITK